MSEPPIPAIIMASVEHEGSMWSLTLVRTHYRSGGSCILEETTGRDKDGEPHQTELIEYGSWCISHPDEGSAVLTIDFECSAPDDVDDWPSLRRALVREAFKQADSWGAETWDD